MTLERKGFPSDAGKSTAISFMDTPEGRGQIYFGFFISSVCLCSVLAQTSMKSYDPNWSTQITHHLILYKMLSYSRLYVRCTVSPWVEWVEKMRSLMGLNGTYPMKYKMKVKRKTSEVPVMERTTVDLNGRSD